MSHHHHQHHHHHHYPHDHVPTDDHEHHGHDHKHHLETYNPAGAAIFWSYIVLALLCTIVILLRLRRLANANDTPTTQRHPSATGPKLIFLSLLALISFTSLSVHMLRFLIESYTAYSTGHLRPIDELARIHLTSGVFLPGPAAFAAFARAVGSQIWQWSVNSRLFVDFAEELMRTSQARAWSTAALLASTGATIWMGDRVRVEGVKGVGWTLGLSQILPVGFGLWLYLIGILLGRKTEGPASAHREGDKVGSAPGQNEAGMLGKFVPGVIPTTIFTAVFVAVITLPSYTGRWQFVPLVLLVRLIMALPFLLPSLLQLLGDQVSGDQQQPPSTSAFQLASMWILFMVGNIWQIGSTNGPSEWWDSLNRSSAVSALGYDLIIGAVGLVLFGCLGGLEPEDSAKHQSTPQHSGGSESEKR
jgi:hypothetical protein